MKSIATAPLAALALLVGGCSTFPAETARSVAPPNTLVFADEFDGGTLDRTKWNVIGMDFWVNRELQAYVDSPETLSFRDGVDGADGGVLVVKPVWRPGVDTNDDRKADFISGRINSSEKFDFQYGRAEARIRMSDAPGFWPAFWMMGYGDWPGNGEIDIMEYVGEKGWTSSALHGPGYSGDTPINERQTFPQGQDATGWHVYAIDWNADRIVFEVDGRPFYTVTKADVEKYGEWRYDNRKYLILNSAVGGIYPKAVNNVEEPYYGLPPATAEKIKAGEVEMLVDWVRVTRTR